MSKEPTFTATPPALDLAVRSADGVLRRARNLAVGPPSKVRDGRFVFPCPHCSEMLAHVNPRTNLAHCFACDRNLNTIDLMRLSGHDFVTAVALLERWLTEYELRHPRRTPPE